MANYLGGGGFDPQAYMMRKLMDELFGGDKEVEQQRQSNKYERLYLQKVGNMEGNYDVTQLDNAYKRGEKFRNDIVSGKYKIPDKEIFLETIDAYQSNLDRQRAGVVDYDSKASLYKNASNELFDLTKTLNMTDDYQKSRNTVKKITDKITEQTQLYSDMATRYSSRFRADLPLNDYMENISTSNQYLLEAMKSGEVLDDFEYDLYSTANQTGDYQLIVKGERKIDALTSRHFTARQDEAMQYHAKVGDIWQKLQPDYVNPETGLGLSKNERDALHDQWPVAQKMWDNAVKLYEENTGEPSLRVFTSSEEMSPWDYVEAPLLPTKDSELTGKLFPTITLEPEIKELPVSALSNWGSWQRASSSTRQGGLSEFFNRDDIVNKPRLGGGTKSVLEFDASNVLSAYENRADKGNIRKQLKEDSQIVIDLSKESGIKAKYIVDILEPKRKELAKGKPYVVDLFDKKQEKRIIKRTNSSIKKLARKSKVKGDYTNFADKVIKAWKSLSVNDKSKYNSFEDWVNKTLMGKELKVTLEPEIG